MTPGETAGRLDVLERMVREAAGPLLGALADRLVATAPGVTVFDVTCDLPLYGLRAGDHLVWQDGIRLVRELPALSGALAPLRGLVDSGLVRLVAASVPSDPPRRVTESVARGTLARRGKLRPLALVRSVDL